MPVEPGARWVGGHRALPAPTEALRSSAGWPRGGPLLGEFLAHLPQGRRGGAGGEGTGVRTQVRRGHRCEGTGVVRAQVCGHRCGAPTAPTPRPWGRAASP